MQTFGAPILHGRAMWGSRSNRRAVRRHGSKVGDSEPVLPRRKPTRDSRISELASDHDRAPEPLSEFRTTDPACGSAQFLAAMVDERPTSRASFGRTPLPAVGSALDDCGAGAPGDVPRRADDVPLLRRLARKGCVYRVGRSAVGAEIVPNAQVLGRRDAHQQARRPRRCGPLLAMAKAAP
jgi:hypothetical protein